MTNAEKYKDLILRTKSICNGFLKPIVLKKYGLDCEDCIRCHVLMSIFLNEEYQEPETDWSQVAVDTPILVKYEEKDVWMSQHFAKYENGMVYAWENGTTSHTNKWHGCTGYLYAKLAEDEKK